MSRQRHQIARKSPQQSPHLEFRISVVYACTWKCEVFFPAMCSPIKYDLLHYFFNSSSRPTTSPTNSHSGSWRIASRRPQSQCGHVDCKFPPEHRITSRVRCGGGKRQLLLLHTRRIQFQHLHTSNNPERHAKTTTKMTTIQIASISLDCTTTTKKTRKVLQCYCM